LIEIQYHTEDVPTHFLERIIHIDNWVEIVEYKEKKEKTINVLFVGRGAPQKRVHIISQIAESVIKSKKEISFTFVGNVLGIVSEYVKARCQVFEYVTNQDELGEIYDEADVLILTSAFEGLPIVVMDMMARGKVVISTAVDGIPDYITHRVSGMLINELADEEAIKNKGIELILELNDNRNLLQTIGLNARQIAIEKFDRNVFEEKYKNVFSISN
jgi:glycosyltransferase involved in cell wall biosynthesis